MSIQFSDTTNKSGLIQIIERLCKFPDGWISGNTNRLKEYTSELNLALDYVWSIIFRAGGTWQFDDSNHTDYPIIKTDLISGQRDYSFTSDENGNIILDIYKVLIAQPDGTFLVIKPVDVQSEDESGFYNGLDTTGTPNKYDKTANGIFLDAIPNYTISGGVKIYINREGSYFSTSDTTKKAGFTGIYHEILALITAYKHAPDSELSRIERRMIKMEEDLTKSYGQREKDVRRGMKTKQSGANSTR
jgi:hypothetical protein